MKKIIFILLSLSLISIVISADAIRCGTTVLEHCLQCDSGERANSCAKCKDKYFFLSERNKCIPCNDEYYGQIGCEGKCDGTNYEETRNILCENGKCKEGFTYSLGICQNCSEISPGCKSCNYKVEEGETEGMFVCNECESNEYKLTDRKCEKCEISDCDKCHFNEDYTEQICDNCVLGYYKSSTGECENAKNVVIEGGTCYIYSDDEKDFSNAICTCNMGYVKVGEKKCIKCSDNCNECTYNQNTKTTTCLNCLEYYVLNSNKECVHCGDECRYCDLDEEKNSISCLTCESGILLSDNSCLKSLEGCLNHIINPSSLNKNESLCTQCDQFDDNNNYYTLSPENKCIKCQDVAGGCSKCEYDDQISKYVCLNCYSNEYSYDSNNKQCILSYIEDERDLTGCSRLNYNSNTNKYECLECYNDYLFIYNNKLCKYKWEIDISSDCLEAKKIDTSDESIYSCSKCSYDSALMTTKDNGKKDCYAKENTLIYCSEGKIDEDDKYICTKCEQNTALNSDGICEINLGYFIKNNKLYKCDDEKEGNSGCVAEKGCNYINNKLNCNECKEGYYQYTDGRCLPCNIQIPNCEKCHFNEEEVNLKCDNCNILYSLSNNKCNLKECNEYPDISPGCIICKDKLNEYKSNNKCQSCDYGYFKTKDEKCVYCRSEKYGGPGCYECGYENKNGVETNNIICKNCFSLENYFQDYYSDISEYVQKDYFDTTILSPNGKCYNYRFDLKEKCLKYEYDNNNNLVCKICLYGYYLDSNGKCIDYTDKIEKKSNCESLNFYIDNLMFFYTSNTNQVTSSKINMYDYINSFNTLNEYIKNKNIIKTTCGLCESGYYVNNEGICDILTTEQCTGKFIIQNINNRMFSCSDLCSKKEYPLIYIKLLNGNIDYDFDNYADLKETDDIRGLSDLIGNDFNFNSINNKEMKEFILNTPICQNFEGCSRLIYIPKTKTIHCLECFSRYILDPKNNICKRIDYDINCNLENIGTKTNPKYSCKSCYYDTAILIQYENGVKECFNHFELPDEDEICIEGKATSEYIKPLYNCTSCLYGFVPIYSKFYQRIICKENNQESDPTNDVSSDLIEGINYIRAKNGLCDKNYFTPDGQRCFKCDNELIGMPGCKGECSFSIDINNMLKCESGCKDGYIESFKGMCQECKVVNNGCTKCHYENNNYPSDYLGIKRKRRFQCDICEEGYVLNEEGKCKICSELFNGCEKCSKDEKTNKIICTQCDNKNYFSEELGECIPCQIINSIINGKCIKCNDINQGGILNCNLCQSNESGNKLICKECTDEYILLTNDNTCIKRTNIDDQEKLKHCKEYKKENGKNICTRCKPEFSLLKTDNNNYECKFIPTLYDPDYRTYYYFKNFYRDHNLFNWYIKNYIDNDYNKNNLYSFPCKEAINLGTNDNPLYSCSKCFNIFENEDNDYDYYREYLFNNINTFFNNINDYNNYIEKLNEGNYGNIPIKIIDETKNNINYCLIQIFDITRFCTEAIYLILNGKEIYNCTKCEKNYKLNYDKQLNINVCNDYENYDEEKTCHVPNCEECYPDDSYYCHKCSSGYELNQYTGFCFSKITTTVPSVTWKDIYRLNMNDQKEIKGKIYNGPSIKLRGITKSKINSEHIFLINLIFKVKHSLRSLEDIIYVTAICQIDNGVEKTEDDINVVDYECMGNTTVDDNYILSGIEELDNERIISTELSKLNEIINEVIQSGEDLTKKDDSVFPDSDNIAVFTIEENEKNKSSINSVFNFNLSGTINKDISLSPQTVYDVEIELYNITDKPKFKLYIGNNRNAKLNVYLELNNDKNKENIYFGNTEIKINDNKYLYAPVLNELILKNDKVTQAGQQKDNKKKNDGGNFKKNILIFAINLLLLELF